MRYDLNNPPFQEFSVRKTEFPRSEQQRLVLDDTAITNLEVKIVWEIGGGLEIHIHFWD